MTLPSACVFILTLLWAPLSFAEEFPCDPGQNGVTNHNDCARATTMHADEELSQKADRLRRCLPEDRRILLDNAQRAWLAYRGEQAAFDASAIKLSEDGYPEAYNRALQAIIGTRAEYVDSMIKQCHEAQ